jgi:flagellar protein FlgJ
MDINSIQSYTDMLSKESASANKLQESLKTNNYANSSDEELLAACKEFEAYFLEMVLKEMQKSVYAFSDKENSANSQIVDYFKDMTIQKLASDSTERQGLGLAQQLFEQMKRNYNM